MNLSGRLASAADWLDLHILIEGWGNDRLLLWQPEPMCISLNNVNKRYPTRSRQIVGDPWPAAGSFLNDTV